MTVKCLAVSVSLKTDKTTPYVQLPPLQCRRGPHGISTGHCSQPGSPAQSGYIRGARGLGRVNQLLQVTQHEAGLPGPLRSWSAEAGTAVSSGNPRQPYLAALLAQRLAQQHRSPWKCGGSFLFFFFFWRLFSTQVTAVRRIVSPQPMKTQINGKQSCGLRSRRGPHSAWDLGQISAVLHLWTPHTKGKLYVSQCPRQNEKLLLAGK